MDDSSFDSPCKTTDGEWEVDTPPPGSTRKSTPYRRDEDRARQTRVVVGRRREVCVDAVFDGHHGKETADWLEQRTREHLNVQGLLGWQEERWVDEHVDVEKVLRRAVRAMDEAVTREMMFRKNTSGAAASWVLTERGAAAGQVRVYVANVGDCDVVLYTRGDDVLQQKSVTHRPSTPSELERLTKLGASPHLFAQHRVSQAVRVRNHCESKEFCERCFAKGHAGTNPNDGLEVSRTMGDWRVKFYATGVTNDMDFADYADYDEAEVVKRLYAVITGEPDVCSFSLQPEGALIVMGSDGFWEAFGNNKDDLKPFLRDATLRGNKSWADYLTDVASQRLGERRSDDMMVVVVDLEQRYPRPPRKFVDTTE